MNRRYWVWVAAGVALVAAVGGFEFSVRDTCIYFAGVCAGFAASEVRK